jgi:anaerobic selenocysteine-containing dehydrogenase
MPTVHHRTCHLCEANCGLLMSVEGREVISVRGDPDNALSRGHICPKATAIADLQNDPDRLRKPQKRTGEGEAATWEEISWDQAFTEIAEKARAILDRDSASAAVYVGNPNAHNYANILTSGDLKKALKSKVMFSASTLDQMPHQVVNLWLYGHSGMWGVPDIDRTETMIILGGNPMASNGSTWTVPDFKNRAKALQKRGGQLIVIDPRRSETAKIADKHIFIKPVGDAWFLIALLLTLDAEGWVAPGRLTPMLSGWDEVWTALRTFDVNDCAARAGVDLFDIRIVAARMAQGPAALYGRIGSATQSYGTLASWLIALANIATGQMDREGGILFTLPAVDTVEALGPGAMGRFHSRVSGHPEVLGEFPAACMAEEIETPGDGQIKALFVLAGNPVLSSPNGRRLDAALAELELFVSIDIYRNETARRAHYILPPAGPLETDHYGMFLLPIAVRNFAKYSPPIFEKDDETLADWEILRRLAGAIEGREPSGPTPPQMLDSMLQSGPYKISLADLADNPSGIDFGALKAGMLPERLRTKEKNLPCAPPAMIVDLARLRAEQPRAADTNLLLIGRRHVRSNNSWLHNVSRLVKGPARCTMMINPVDARARNLGDGSIAEVSSRVGMIKVPVEVSDDMMPGTVSIPHGWGHDLPGVQLSVAGFHAGVSINDLTDETALDPISGNAALSGVPVEVRAAG